MLLRQFPRAAGLLTLAVSLAAPLLAHGAEAMRVIRDPKTGELRGPNAAEAAAYEKAQAQLRAQRGKTDGPPAEIKHPDGSVEFKLGEEHMMSSVAVLGADGSLSYACLPAKEADKLVKSPKKQTALKTAAKKAGHTHE
jgi:hypothetical protein